MRTRFFIHWLVLVWMCIQSVRAQPIEVLFAYGSEKEDWIKETTASFNKLRQTTKSGKIIFIKHLPMGSGECMDGVQSGRVKAHLVSPASGVFIKLANATARARTGKDLVGDTENLVLSPVVIAMWKPMAEALSPDGKALGWGDVLNLTKAADGWGSVGMGQWGRFKLGHTHPDFSNSGLISIIAEAYAGAGKTSGLTLEDVVSEAVGNYMGAIEGAIVHYGVSTGFFGKKMFNNGPAYLSAAVLYENMVIESYSDKYKMPFPVVAIYPKEGTFWSDHPAGVVQADWVTPEHVEAGKLYLRYLLARPQQERAMTFGFRPGLVEVPLASPIDEQHGVNPKEPKTTLEVPKPEVVNKIVEVWRQKKKHANVVLVFDTSGSMNEEDRITNARRGAQQMLKLMADEDTFSLMPFSSKFSWALRDAPLKTDRKRALSMVGALFPEGGTALYDSISAAHRELTKTLQPGVITAIVVLTDGQDTNSRTSLTALQAQIRFDSEKNNIRIFTIGYGKDANMSVLRNIAEGTQAKNYEGTNENIDTVFKDISTFF